jgi:hypothetical protein
MLSRVVSARRLLSAVRRRPTLSAALAYALLSLLLFAPALLPGHTLSASDYLWSGAPWTAERPAGVQDLGSNYEEADAVLQFQPFLQYAARDLPDVPLWNPHQMGGRPFVGNSQSALFSPFNWPSLLLPFWWSLGLAAALKVLCAALGAHLLARALAIRYAGALLAGLVYGFGLFFVVWLSWPLSSVWAWLPWLLLCVWTVVRRPGPRPVAALALVVALQFFGGHPESSFHVLAAGSFFALLALSRVGRGERLRAIGRLAAGLAAGSLLAAIALLPFLELLARSGDLENRQGKTGGHFPVTALIDYVLPEYWGRPSQAPTQAFAFSRAYYAGALPLMLALWALVAQRTRERVAIAAGGVVAIALTVGFPGLFELVTAFPGFDHAYNQRLIIVGLLALALLAGWGLGDVLDGVHRPRLLLGAGLVLWRASTSAPGRSATGWRPHGRSPSPRRRPPRTSSRWPRRGCGSAWPGRRSRCCGCARPAAWPGPRSQRSRSVSSCSTSSAWGWGRTRPSARSTPSSPSPRRCSSCSTTGPRASSGSRRRSARRRSHPTSPCATGSTTRAATTSRSSAATTGSGGRRSPTTRTASRRRRCSPPPRSPRCARSGCWGWPT